MADIPADELPTPPRGIQQLPLPLAGVRADVHLRRPEPPTELRAVPVPSSETPRGAWRTTPGPVDRVSFFEEQRRNRRATWRTSLACTVAILLAGIPLGLVAAPVLYPMVLVAAKLVSLIVPVQGWIVRLVEGDLVQLLDRIDAHVSAPNPTVPVADLLLLGALVALPGMLMMLCLWLALRFVFARHGVGAMLLGLGAREPRAGDLEERQLANVVAEMAIAAGLPPPRVLLLDSDIANAAVLGSSPGDAVVLVSRRVLDRLDRDETQGLLAHLIGSIGNGDLKIALRLVTVFRTFGLVSTLLESPVSSSARAALWRLLKLLVWPSRDSSAESDAVLDLLTARTASVDTEDVDAVLGGKQVRNAPRSRGLGGLLTKVRVWVLFPFWFATGMAKIMLMVLTSNVLAPLVALTWRTRRSLADATAVQLTRYPDGLARALLHVGGSMPGAEWASHLFVVGWASVSRGGFTGDGSVISFHPPIDQRLRRLRALGAAVAEPGRRSGWFGHSLHSDLMTIFFFVPMMTLIAILTVVALVLLFYLLVFFVMIALVPTVFLYAFLFAA
jgi:Zn-dependent protease with chaperone function